MTSSHVDDKDIPGYSHLRETLLVPLEGLLQSLTHSTDSAGGLQATADAARAGVGAEVAFWFSKTGSRVSRASRGECPMSHEQSSQFARKLLAVVPKELEVFRWVNPDMPTPAQPTAAIVTRTLRASGCLFLITFKPGHRFDRGNEEIARITLKIFVGLRVHAHEATKQLLNGLIHSLTACTRCQGSLILPGTANEWRWIALIIGKELDADSLPHWGSVSGRSHSLTLAKLAFVMKCLWKPGKLTAAEFDEIKLHPTIRRADRVVYKKAIPKALPGRSTPPTNASMGRAIQTDSSGRVILSSVAYSEWQMPSMP